MYIGLGMSSLDISQKLGYCSEPVVQRRLKEYGIPVRSNSEARNMPRSLTKSSQYNLKRYQNPYEVERTKQALLKYHYNNSYARKVAHEGQVRRFSDPDEREKDRQGQLRRYQDPLEHEKSSLAQYKRWRNLTTRQRDIYIQSIIKSYKLRPTSPELCVQGLLNSAYPYEWKYTGNGQVIIGGLNPDFTNINGKKQVIEMFGNYWHSEARTNRTKKQEVRYRHKTYAKYGFSTLVIWEDELKDQNKVVKKISKFVEADKSIRDYLRPLYRIAKIIRDLWDKLRPMRNIRRNISHGH